MTTASPSEVTASPVGSRPGRLRLSGLQWGRREEGRKSRGRGGRGKWRRSIHNRLWFETVLLFIAVTVQGHGTIIATLT